MAVGSVKSTATHSKRLNQKGKGPFLWIGRWEPCPSPTPRLARDTYTYNNNNNNNMYM